MSTKSLLHQARLNKWLKHFADHKASGLSVTDWCLQNNISKYKFFYWKRLLKDEAVTQMLPSFSVFLQMSIKSSTASAKLSVCSIS